MVRVCSRLCGLWLVCCLLFAIKACGPPPICDDDAVPSPLTINPNGSPCQRKCECNNQNYEGYCSSKGVCDAFQRDACSKRGGRRGCRVRPVPEGGNCPSGLQVCGQDLKVRKWGDCKPLNKKEPEVSKELCGDGIDNDCDGIYDKSDPDCKDFCNPGQVRPCYSGPQGTENKGVCAGGSERCNTVTGKWSGVCLNEVKPQSEICNKRDDDCNGRIDDAPECVCSKEGEKEPCYGGPTGTATRGSCKSGFRVCEKQKGATRWGVCQEQILPSKEVCNNKDDNCNGIVDEGCPCALGAVRPCGSALGNCKPGEQRCQGGVWSGSCYAESGPTPEVCDGRDNDCNGFVDDSLNRQRKTNCGPGEEKCESGRWAKCSAPKPKPETCNLKDDDCNGLIDDSVRRICRSACGEGLEFCVEGRWLGCSALRPQPERCDGKDNDCNGKIDDKVQETGTLCKDTSKIGLCQRGEVVGCVKGKLVCESTTKPAVELCDGLDNDCDGRVDEGALLCVQQVAGSGKPGLKDDSGAKAQFNKPIGLLWTSQLGLLVVDSGNHRIRQIELSSGKVKTWAGSTQGFKNGARLTAQFHTPFAIEPSRSGSIFYVTDSMNHRIRSIDSTGLVSSYAGSGKKGLKNDKNFARTEWNLPKGLRLNGANLTVVDSGNAYVRFIEQSVGTIETYLSKKHSFGSNGLQSYEFKEPIDFLLVSATNTYVSDAGNHQILWLDTKKKRVILIGTGSPGYVDGAAGVAQFNRPMGMAADAHGNLYVADSGNHCIRKISLSGYVTTVAGTGKAGRKGGLASGAMFNTPMHLAFDQKGDLYISDTNNHTIRKLILTP